MLVEEDAEEEETGEEDTEIETSDVDFSDFSRDEQSVGKENENEYSLLSLTDEDLEGYHRFTFVNTRER